MQLKKILHISLITFALFLITSCDTTNPQSNKKVTLTAEDASCTEVWLNVKTKNISLPTTVRITQDDSTVITTNINKGDTTLIVEKLQPNRAYTFKATIEKDKVTDQTQITTMDTTSHNFTWETFTFGDRSSVLNDVAIINENNIWAVGEIHTKDTDKFDNDSNWVQPYNAVHWDGNSWELRRIMFYTFCNQEHKAPYPARSIFSFNDGIIAITSGSQITYIKNGNQQNIECISVSINAIWGTSSDDFYVVGYGGNIAHYNGSSWEKIESGTDLSIHDIWGDYNEKTGKWEVLAVASNITIDKGNKLISILNNTSTPLLAEGLGWAIQTIWFKTKKKYLIGGDGLFQTSSLLNTWETNKLVPNIWTVSLNGVGVNDIFSTGPFGMILHYNGITWHDYTNETKYNGVCYGTTSINNNLVAISGATSTQGIILIGRR